MQKNSFQARIKMISDTESRYIGNLHGDKTLDRIWSHQGQGQADSKNRKMPSTQ